MTAHEQVEFLVCTAQFQIRLQSHRVVALHERVQKLVHADGRVGMEAVMKIVALHHARHGVLGCQLNHAHRTQWNAPLAVVANFGFGGVEHQRGLLVIRLGVHLDLLRCERRTRAVAARRIANQTGEVTNQENHLMPQVLQLAHFVEHHGVADVNVGRCRVQAQFDAQRLARRL